MTCASAPAIFRLLDAYVGWDGMSLEGLTGQDDPGGLRLAALDAGMDDLDETTLSQHIPPPRLAAGCGPCEWYLLTKALPATRLLHLGPCDNQWRPVWTDDCPLVDLADGVGLATSGHRIVVADRAQQRVRIWESGGRRQAASVPAKRPGPIAIAPWREIILALRDHDRLLRFDFAGGPRGVMPQMLPDGVVDRMAFDDDCRLWLVVRLADDSFQLWTAGRDDGSFSSAGLSDLVEAFPRNDIAEVANNGFCLIRGGPDGAPQIVCFDWYGRPLAEECLSTTNRRRFVEQGQLLTLPLDSGIPRCRWHRVRIDADLPNGAGLSLSVSTSENPSPPAQGSNTSEWSGFADGVPHPKDWQDVSPGTLDFLVDQPAGRYLFVRLRLTGNGIVTPVVRRVRIDFPRSTSLDSLPAVYREDETASDFSERFLSLFDAVIEDVDAAIERFPALLDGDGVPEEVLPWIAQFLGIVFDTAWDAERRRRILRAAPELYRKRGTVAGLSEAVDLVFDVVPVIEELGAQRHWGAVAARVPSQSREIDARLGTVRLFGRSRARLRLGESQIGQAAIRSYGNPDADPHNAQAHRFRTLVPPGTAVDPASLLRLVEGQKPAHTLAEVRAGGEGFVVGTQAQVGIDTALALPPPPVLSQTTARLNRIAVLRAGRGMAGPRFRPGMTSAVGINTVLE